MFLTGLSTLSIVAITFLPGLIFIIVFFGVYIPASRKNALDPSTDDSVETDGESEH